MKALLAILAALWITAAGTMATLEGIVNLQAGQHARAQQAAKF